jgi:serine/threonine protein kinase/WD40 repeat protein/tetratricopeptide (TPR) repeat protein
MMSDPSSDRDPVERLAEEFAERHRRGERPSLNEYTDRYPEHAEAIRALFPALVMMEQFKPGSVDGTGDYAPAAAQRLERLGDYRILREVGRGGMGVVYEAEQVSLGRHVALKVLPSHAILDPRQLLRFQREARSAARLHHTNIVPVYGVGEAEGLHFYVMQFIQGQGLDQVLAELRRLRMRNMATAHPGDASAVAQSLLSGRFVTPPDDPVAAVAPVSGASGTGVASSSSIRLPGQSDPSTLTESGRAYWQSVARIGIQVAEALSYAAAQGTLHRDVKPSNLLLDERGNVWVADFGLAKAAADLDDLTHTGDIVGTLRYMAPERFSGRGDVRADLYSLGLTLYELLTLRPAFADPDRNKLVKRVMHDEPVRPRKLNPAVPRDLETVVLKAIARDPAHRYQTPAEMAEDLRRFVEDRPVKARRVSESEKFWRWCRRNPLPASLLAGMVLLFLAGFVGVSWQWRVAEAARQDEKSQRSRADGLRESAETARDEAKQARNAAARQAAGLLLDRGIEDARGGEPARALHLFVQALRALPPDDMSAAPLERVIRANLTAWAETVPALEHISPGGAWNVVYSPDGDFAATTVGGKIQCYQTDTGRPVGPAFEVPGGVGDAMAFAHDGRSIWVSSAGPPEDVGERMIGRFDPISGRLVQPAIRVPSTGPLHELFVTPDGRYLVATVWGLHPDDRGPKPNAFRDRRWRLAFIMAWDTATGRVVRKVEINANHFFAWVDLSPDGKRVSAWVPRSPGFEGISFTVAGNEPPIRLGALGGGPFPKGADATINFQNNLRTALVIIEGQVHRWSVTNPGVFGPGVPTPFPLMHESPSPDGRSVISRPEGRVFDTGAWPPRPSGIRFAHPGWQQEEYATEKYSPDGRFLVTWLKGRSVGNLMTGEVWRLWRLPHPHSRPSLPASEWGRESQQPALYGRAAFDAQGTRVALNRYPRVGHLEGEPGSANVRLVDVVTGAVRGTAVRHSAWVRDVVFSPDGHYFATGGHDGTARVWEAATGRPAGPVLVHTNYIPAVAFSPDGNILAAGDYGPAGLIKLWDWRTGREVRPALRHDDIVLNVSFSPDGRYLAAFKRWDWSKKAELVVWEVGSGTAVFRVPFSGPADNLRPTAQFRPDSRAVANHDENAVVRLWDVPSGKLLGERQLEGARVTRFSPDGRRIAVAANLGVRLLDGDTLAPLPGGFLPHPDPIRHLAFSPDGASLLTAHESGSAQLWDLATCKPVGPPAVLIGPILAVAFTPDGKTCLCVAADGTVRRWPVPAPFDEPDLARLADRVALMTGQRVDDSHGLDSIPVDEWRALRGNLVGDGSTALVPPWPDADWHDAVAADAEQDGDAYGAEWHLDRLAKLRPNDWTIPARRGRVLAAAGRRDEADNAYAAARRLAPTPQVLSDWLRATAADDEVAGRNAAVLWNLDQAIALTPGDWTLYAVRADLTKGARALADEDEAIRLGAEPTLIERAADRAAESGNWKRAAALLTTLARNPDTPIPDRYNQAVASLKAGDAAGYRAACAGMAERLPRGDPRMVHHDSNSAARATVLGPNATDDWSRTLAWTDRALTRLAEIEKVRPHLKEQIRTERNRFMNTRGAVLYRAGRFEEASKVLREAMSLLLDGGEFHNSVFLALAEHRLGHTDAAKKAAARARSALTAKPGAAWERAEMELFAAELDTALPAGK